MSEIINGGDVLVSILVGETEDDQEFVPIAHQTECSIEHKTNFRERRTKDTKGKERFPDETDSTISVSALNVYGEYSYFDLRKIQVSRKAVLIQYCMDSATLSSGKYEEGWFYIESLKRSDNEGDDSKVDVTFVQKEEPKLEGVG